MNTKIGRLAVLFYSISTLFGSFNAESSHFGLVYGISTTGYLIPNIFLFIKNCSLSINQFDNRTQFKYQKQFYFKQFNLA